MDAVGKTSPGIPDDEVISRAVAGKRLLLTEDKDFGELVYAHQRESGGVILMRVPASARTLLRKAVLDIVTSEGEKLIGKFVVVQLGKVRISQLPRR